MKQVNLLLLAAVVVFLVTTTSCGPSKAQIEAEIRAVEEQKTQEAFDTAKKAFTSLCEANDIVVSVMNSIYGAWYFGIYKADDSSSTTIIINLAKEVALSESELNAGVTSMASRLSVKESTLKYAMNKGVGDSKAWEYCLYAVNESYIVNGSFDKIQTNINIANAALKTMTNDFDDYKHYPTLKELYAKISAYYVFAQSPSGSFQQLKDTINGYENDIRTLISDLSFVFE